MSGSPFDALLPPDNSGKRAAGVMDLVDLPDGQRALVTWMMRQNEVTLAEASQQLGLSLPDSETTLLDLQTKGFVERVDQSDPPRFRPKRLVKRASRLSSDLWRALDDKAAS